MSTLGRQLLLRRESLGVADAVRRVVALQAQQAASPYLALWNRLIDFDPAEARSLVDFLADREPEVYGRYNHWWSKLPSAEARLLPGD